MKSKSDAKRSDLISVAYRLFEEHGFHATGVDMIVREAKTTKRTLYRIFGSKENLALEVLRRHDEDFRREIHQRIELPSSAAKERLLSLFDYYGAWFASENFRGCIFIKTMVEFETSSRILRNAARESKELLRGYIEKLCRAAEASDPGLLANQLQILLEGSIIVAQAKANAQVANTAKRIASDLIDEALPCGKSA